MQECWDDLTCDQKKKLRAYKQSISKVLSKMQALAEDEDEFILYIVTDIDLRLEEIPDEDEES